jgi:hypothetical protein
MIYDFLKLVDKIKPRGKILSAQQVEDINKLCNDLNKICWNLIGIRRRLRSILMSESIENDIPPNAA